MGQIISACGYISTGSSAICDLLKEFDEVQVLDDFELSLIYYPDGLEDLDWHLNEKCAKEFGTLSIDRFRRLMYSKGFMNKFDKSKIKLLTEEFLSKIIQVTWNGLEAEERDKLIWFFRRGLSIAVGKVAKKLDIKEMPKIYFSIVSHRRELAACPENFNKAAREYVSALLDLSGFDKDKKITLLNQSFAGNNPIKGFKYFDSPKAIIVDRDARDCYLFAKKFLRNRGQGLQIAVDSVGDFIKWYRTVRTCPDKTIGERSDILFMNFEELIYDYEKAVVKVANFCNVDKHIHKGKFFKPTWSRNNTQLFKKYSGFESDIAEIEKRLPEYLFPFENYPDIKSEGEMFFGSQSKRG